METKDYLLVGVCVVAALLLFFRMAKENKVFIGAGVLCLFYGGYYVAQAYLDEGIVDIFRWILRGVAVILLIWMFTVLSGERAKSKAAQAEAEAAQTEEVSESTSEEAAAEAVTEENDAQ